MPQTPESHESHEGGAGIVFEPTPGVDLRGEVLSLLAGLGASWEVCPDLGVVYVTTARGAVKNAPLCI